MSPRPQPFRPLSHQRRGRPNVKKRGIMHVRFPDQHYVDAIKAEAAVRNMSVCSFLRAMVRGYFAAALHCK